MDPLVKTHAMRVIPMPGDTILCANMKEPMRVVQVNVYLKGRTLVAPERHLGFVVSEPPDPDGPVVLVQHTCRPKTCMYTIEIRSRLQGDFEKKLLHRKYKKGRSNGSTG